MYDKNNWRFDSSVVECFDEHINMSVPMYNEFHKNIVEMSSYFIQSRTNVIDVGTSTGTLLKKIKESNKREGISFIGIDKEKAMIEECTNKRYNRMAMKFITCDALDFDYNNSSVVTCMLSLQFIEKSSRVQLLKSIYDGLNQDGALFVVEKVKTDIVDIHDIYNDMYYDFKRKLLSDKDVLDKNESLRGVMKPITLNENIANLRSAGFTKIDVFMKYNNFAGIVAVK